MEVQPDRSPHARQAAFTRPDEDGMGTEREVSLLLAAHVRWLKPSLVIETGTFHADTTVLLYQALAENAAEGHGGELRTYEVDPKAYEASVRRLAGLKIHAQARLYAVPRTLQEDLSSIGHRLVDLAFIDSSYDAREADVETLTGRMAPRGLLFVHDADMRPMRPIVRAWRREWRLIGYPTPRGLALLQRRWKSD